MIIVFNCFALNFSNSFRTSPKQMGIAMAAEEKLRSIISTRI